jgi:23S rRNA (guanosine2251-2'-O)-methyltransferase
MKEFLYSRNAVYESLRAGRRDAFTLLVAQGTQEKGRLKEIIQLADQRKIPVERVPRTRLDKIHSEHQGIALEASGYPYVNMADILDLAKQRDELLFVLLLDALQDPQNLGALLRTAETVGVHGVIIPLARTAQVTPAVVNASSGATEHLLLTQANLHQTIRELKLAGAWIVGLDQAGGTVVSHKADEALRGALGLVVGSEGQGMRPLVRESCDFLLKLPMRGQVESLNAAVAGSVALYLAYLARE